MMFLKLEFWVLSESCPSLTSLTPPHLKSVALRLPAVMS